MPKITLDDIVFQVARDIMRGHFAPVPAELQRAAEAVLDAANAMTACSRTDYEAVYAVTFQGHPTKRVVPLPPPPPPPAPAAPPPAATPEFSKAVRRAIYCEPARKGAPTVLITPAGRMEFGSTAEAHAAMRAAREAMQAAR